MRFTRPVCPAEDVGKDQARTPGVIARARPLPVLGALGEARRQ
jgi:hypothetical protein